VFSTADHPQPFWPGGRTEQFLGLRECCVLVARSCYDEDGAAEAADRANRLEVARRDVQPWAKLDEQERGKYRREWSQPDANPVFDGARSSRVHGFENDRVEARWLRAEQDGCATEGAANDPDPARGSRALQPLECRTDITGLA